MRQLGIAVIVQHLYLMANYKDRINTHPASLSNGDLTLELADLTLQHGVPLDNLGVRVESHHDSSVLQWVPLEYLLLLALVGASDGVLNLIRFQ